MLTDSFGHTYHLRLQLAMDLQSAVHRCIYGKLKRQHVALTATSSVQLAASLQNCLKMLTGQRLGVACSVCITLAGLTLPQSWHSHVYYFWILLLF